jgi:hypothetical protein
MSECKKSHWKQITSGHVQSKGELSINGSELPKNERKRKHEGGLKEGGWVNGLRIKRNKF